LPPNFLRKFFQKHALFLQDFSNISLSVCGISRRYAAKEAFLENSAFSKFMGCCGSISRLGYVIHETRLRAPRAMADQELAELET
jgi:hypothetical protein